MENNNIKYTVEFEGEQPVLIHAKIKLADGENVIRILEGDCV